MRVEIEDMTIAEIRGDLTALTIQRDALRDEVWKLKRQHPLEWPAGQSPTTPGLYWFRMPEGDSVLKIDRLSQVDPIERIHPNGRWLGPAVPPRKLEVLNG